MLERVQIPHNMQVFLSRKNNKLSENCCWSVVYDEYFIMTEKQDQKQPSLIASFSLICTLFY